MNSSPNPTDEELYLLLTIMQFVPTTKKKIGKDTVYL